MALKRDPREIPQAPRESGDNYQLPHCAVCGRESWTSRLDGTRLRRCKACGTYLHDRSASRLAEEGIYQDGQAAATNSPETTARAQLLALRQLLPDFDTRDRSVLDIGCGNGEFLCEMRESGWRVAGLELDAVSAAACLEKGLDVRTGSIFDEGLPSGPWSVITLWDVLDHLEEPVRALQLVYQALAMDGVVVLRGRNAGFHAPLKRVFARTRAIASACGIPDVTVVHRWGITAPGWQRMVERAGFKAVRLYPAAMTPGDRYGSMGPRKLAAAAKRLAGGVLLTAHSGSRGKIYPFPSVLLTGRKALNRDS